MTASPHQCSQLQQLFYLPPVPPESAQPTRALLEEPITAQSFLNPPHLRHPPHRAQSVLLLGEPHWAKGSYPTTPFSQMKHTSIPEPLSPSGITVSHPSPRNRPSKWHNTFYVRPHSLTFSKCTAISYRYVSCTK